MHTHVHIHTYTRTHPLRAHINTKQRVHPATQCDIRSISYGIKAKVSFHVRHLKRSGLINPGFCIYKLILFRFFMFCFCLHPLIPGDTVHIPAVFHTLWVVREAPGAAGKQTCCYKVVVQQAEPQQKMDLVSVKI